MLKNKYLLLPLMLLMQLIPNTFIYGQQRLSDFDFGSASVLPFFIDGNKKYFILSREARGKDRGTYDDFGGKRDHNLGPNKDQAEPHPLITAGREFFEEAILALSIGFSLKATQDFIDIKNNNTKFIIANSKNVAYITDFSNYAGALFNNFYSSFNKVIARHLKEKDRLAVVEWNELKTTIARSRYNTGVTISARVLDPQSLQWVTESIVLRPYFVKKYRPFFMDQPYQQGMDKRIRFYNIIPVITATPKTARPIKPAVQMATKQNIPIPTKLIPQISTKPAIAISSSKPATPPLIKPIRQVQPATVKQIQPVTTTPIQSKKTIARTRILVGQFLEMDRILSC